MKVVDDDRAETERMRLLRLVHDADSPTKNLASHQANEAMTTKDNDDCFDLSGLQAKRFPARVAVTATTNGHRTAAYSTTAEPVPRVQQTAAPIDTVLVYTPPLDTAPSVPPPLDTAPSVPLPLTAPSVPLPLTAPSVPLPLTAPTSRPLPSDEYLRQAPTVRVRRVEVRQRSNDTIQEERTEERRPRARRFVAGTLGVLAVVLIVAFWLTLTREPGASASSTVPSTPKDPAIVVAVPGPASEAPTRTTTQSESKATPISTTPLTASAAPSANAPKSASAPKPPRAPRVDPTPRSPNYDRSFE